MTLALFLLFTILPLIELGLLFWIGGSIGSVNTLLLILFSGLIGTYMARSEGAAVLRRLTETLRAGKAPGNQITEGFMILCGGLLLITPGVITDLFGFSMLFQPFRQRVAPLIKSLLLKRLSIQDMSNIQGDGIYTGSFSAGPAQRKAEKVKPKETKKPPKVQISTPQNSNTDGANQLFDNEGWDHPIVD